MFEAYFDPQLQTFLQTSQKEQALAIGNANSRFRTFEMVRLLALTVLSSIISLMLPFSTASQELWDQGGALKHLYMAAIDSSSFHILAVAMACKAIECCPQTLATPKLFLYVSRVPLIYSCGATLMFSSVKLPVVLGVIFLWSLHNKQHNNMWYQNISHFANLITILYSSIFATHYFGLLDCIFGIALIFVHRVGKYRPGAVRLAEMFTFLYLQTILLAIFTLIFNLETLNFTETEVIWNNFPSLAKDLIAKLLLYLSLITFLLSGIQHVRILFDDPKAPEKFTFDYNSSVLANFIFRDFLGMVPSDILTKQHIEIVNGRNLVGLFILSNLYLYQSWLSLPANILFILYSEAMTSPSHLPFRSWNLYIHLIKFLLRFTKPLQLLILRQTIWLAEELFLDERYLRLLFFDISQLGRHSTCEYTLPYLEANKWEQRLSCGLSFNWMFICGYILVGFHLITVPVVMYLKRTSNSVSLLSDFIMIFQEVTLVILLTAGLCFGFYTDLLLIAASVYVMLSPFRVGFEDFT